MLLYNDINIDLNVLSLAFIVSFVSSESLGKEIGFQPLFSDKTRKVICQKMTSDRIKVGLYWRKPSVHN